MENQHNEMYVMLFERRNLIRTFQRKRYQYNSQHQVQLWILFLRKKKKCCRSYFSDRLQQTKVDGDKTVKVFIGKPEALHIKVQLSTISKVRHLLGQLHAAQDQGIVLYKVVVHEAIDYNSNIK